ncbi:MAG: hypothetical protein Q9180_006971 [Flavoplaca navasiana]
MACSLIPSEIRLRIFEFCPDVPTAASLAQISKPFNDTWMSYKKPICLGILERSVECYEDARNLVTQDMFESRVTTEVLEQSFEDFTTCILANAKVLELTYHTILHEPAFFGPIRHREHLGIVPNRITDGLVSLSTVERQRFVSALYRIRTIAAMLLRDPERGVCECLPMAISDHDVFLTLEVARTLYFQRANRATIKVFDLEVKHVASWDGELQSNEMASYRAMEHLQAIAASRISQLGIRRTPGYCWGMAVLLDAYQDKLERLRQKESA